MTDPTVPPVVPAPYAGAQATASEPRRSRFLGVTGFVLSLLAFVGDIVAIAVVVGSLVSALGDVARLLEGRDASLSGVAVLLVALVVAGGLGTLLALTGLILGIAAAATRRGRALGVTAIVLGALVLVTRIAALVAALAPHGH